MPSTVGRFIPPFMPMEEEVNEAEREWIEKLAPSSTW